MKKKLDDLFQLPPPPARGGGSGKDRPALPLGEQAYISIKSLILRQELRPGDQLSVVGLSEQTGLGRSPVHLAIHRLEREGLIEILPRKGIFVKEETLDSFFELISARLFIEPYLTGLAVERSTEEFISKLEDLLKIGWSHHESRDHFGVMMVDRIFHQMLYHQAGNSILAEFAERLLDRSMRLWFQNRPSERSKSNIRDLELLLEELKKPNKEGASMMMFDHINALKERFIHS